MRRYSKLAGTVGLAAMVVGCNDFLTGGDLDRDPNRPNAATIHQLFTGVQVQQFILQTGSLARLTSMWTQQMAGTDRQYIQQALYDITEDDFSTEWDTFYGGGGLIDLRAIQDSATASNDLVYRGVALAWEGLLMGTVTSLWGDVPYSEAVRGIDAPALDPQAQVYDSIQSVLSRALTDLASATGAGPGSTDMVYGGDVARWTAAVHTLKARYFLHTAMYDSALVHAQSGIADAAGDFSTFHTGAATEANIWHQFFRERDSYMRVGKTLVDTMNARNDPRRALYFAQNQSGQFVGAAQGEPQSATHSTLSATRADPAFRQPVVTWAENQLILAEAAARLGNTTLARQALNAVRTAAGLGSLSSSGGALLRDIMIEKWIALFQNIEAYTDYRRTCVPNLAPAGNATRIPARIFYAFSERNTNPNIPAPEAQPVYNPLDDANATTPTGTACLGQAPATSPGG